MGRGFTRAAAFALLLFTFDAHAGWAAFTPPAERCNTRLTKLAPETIDALELALRWIGMMHPVLEATLAAEEDWRTRLCIVNLATAYSISPERMGLDTRPEYGWYHREQNFIPTEQAAAAEDRKVLSKPPGVFGRAHRAKIIDRLLRNLKRVAEALKDRERRAWDVSIASPTIHNNRVNLGLTKAQVRVLGEAVDAATTGLEDERVIGLVRVFLFNEIAHVVRLYSALAARAAATSVGRRAQLDPEVASARALLDRRITEFCRAKHRITPLRIPLPVALVEAAAAIPKAPFDALRFTNDPTRLLSRPDGDFAVRDAEREVHEAGAGLSDILIRAQSWDDRDVDWGHWSRTRDPGLPWITGFLAALHERRQRTFRLMVDLERTRGEIEAMRVWTSRELAMIAAAAPDTSSLAACTRVSEVVENTAAAMALRARREDTSLATVHTLEMMVSRFLNQRLAGEGTTDLPAELGRSLDELASPSKRGL